MSPCSGSAALPCRSISFLLWRLAVPFLGINSQAPEAFFEDSTRKNIDTEHRFLSKVSEFPKQRIMPRTPPADTVRALVTRTDGLFRKANTLFHLLHPRVAVFILPANGQSQAYVSHNATDWPAVHDLVGTLGLTAADVRTPDDIDTVSQRFGRTTPSLYSGRLSTPSLSSTTSGNENSYFMEMLAPLAEEVSAVVPSSAADTDYEVGSVPANIGGSDVPTVWSVPSTPEPSSKQADARAPEARMLPASAPDARRERRVRNMHSPLSAGVRKSKSSSKHESKRHKIITRSHDQHRRERH